MALASSVTALPTCSSAAISAPMRNICGVCASHLSLRSTVDGHAHAARAVDGSLERVGQLVRQQAAHAVVGAFAHQRADLRGRDQAARGVVHQHPVVRLRAARLQGTQAAQHRVGARGAAAGHQKRPGAAWPSKKSSPGATTTSVPRRRATPAKAASVCSTMGWPATLWYCLGSACPASPPGCRTTARDPGAPAQGSSGPEVRRASGMAAGRKPRPGRNRWVRSWGHSKIAAARPAGALAPHGRRTPCAWISPNSPPANVSPCPALLVAPMPCCWPAWASARRRGSAVSPPSSPPTPPTRSA